MDNVNLQKIKEMTNKKIGYSNYEKEEFMRKKFFKYGIYSISICCLLAVGTITVNAATNNGIINFINRVIKVNGQEKEASIYTEGGDVFYDERTGEYITNTESKCIEYSPFANSKESTSVICFPLDTEFDEIEIYYDDNNFFSGYHISGISNGEEFDYKVNSTL